MSNDLGVSTPHPVPPGVAKYQSLIQGGFSKQEADQWAQAQTARLAQGGFKPSEIDAYWGNSTPSSPALADHVARNVQAYTVDNPHLTTNPMEAFSAGFDRSVTGLIKNGRAPTSVTPENAGIVSQVMNGVGQFAGDLPASIVGSVGGVAAGGGGGAAVAAPTGELAAPVTVPVGAVIGGGFGFGATPEAARQILLDSYMARDGKIKTWQDAVHVISHSLWETTKEGVVGAVTNLAGGKSTEILAKAGASKLITAGGSGAAQVIAGTSAGAALNGHVPDAADFTTAALMTLGLHGISAAHMATKGGLSDAANRVQSNLEKLYRQTGVPPWEAAERAQHDPVFAQELRTQDPNGDPVTPQFRNAAPGDPPAYKPAVRESGLMEEHTTGWLQPETMRNITPGARPGGGEPSAAPAQRGPQPSQKLLVHYATDVPHAMDLLRTLEGSADDAVSPKGAIGRYQIMPATARQYMGNDFDVHSLFDPAVNKAVAARVVGDLFKRFQGNMNAIAIAYNAGPGRAGEYMKAGPGSALEAIPDKTMRGGIRYESHPTSKDESFLPTETQKYLANERRKGGGGGNGGPPEEPQQIPSRELTLAREGGGGGGGGQPPRVPGEPGSPEDENAKFWAKASDEATSEEMLRNIGEQPSKPGFSLDRVMGQLVSELTPARRIDDRLIKAGEMNRTTDIGAEDMFRQTYASDMRTGAFIKYGEIDPITLRLKIGTPSVMDAVASVKAKGGDMKGWTAYMLAKRTVDKMGQGVDTGFNQDAAMSLASSKKAGVKYDDATTLWNSVMDGVLRYSRDSGVHSDEQIAAMKRDNPAYISMRRIMGDDESFNPSGRGFQSSDVLRRMEGSDKQIVDPIAATLDNMRLIVKMADRNRAIGHIIGMVERGEIENPGILKIEDSQSIKNPDEKLFKVYGLPPEEGTSTYAPLLAERAANGSGDPNTFVYIRNGKPELWRASDPMLAALMRKADKVGMDPVIRTFQTFAALERSGVVINPDFPTRVQLRHQVTAFIMDPLHPAPFLTWLNGISHVIKQDDLYKQAITQGALGVSLADMDANWLARDMDKVFEETGTFDGVVNSFKHPIQLFQVISERMDAAARIGYMKQAMAKDIDPIKAATMSRKAYLDYAERGTAQIANWMASVIPFFRPHILGLKQFGEAVVERPASTAAYSVAAVALPMVALYALNYFQDQTLPPDRQYRNLPQWQKDNYFITPEIAGMRFRLRTPPNAGFVLGGLLNRFLDWSVQQDKHAFEGSMKRFLDEFIPPMLPTIAQTPMEVASNHSFFTGQALIPGSMEKNSGYMQYTPQTSETGKALSRALGPPGIDVADFSPIQLDQYVKGWTGTLGANVLKALDIPVTKVQEAMNSPFVVGKKPGELADLPFVGSFLVRSPGMSAQPLRTFYDEMGKLEAKSNDFALAMKRAESGQIGEIDVTAPAGQYASAVEPLKEAIGVQVAAIQAINSNKDMSAAEKRQATDQLMTGLIETSREGVRVIDEINASAKQAAKEAAAPSVAPGGQTPPPQQPAAIPEPGAARGQVPIA